MKGIKYAVYRTSIRYLDSNFIHPNQLFGFEKFLMRQGKWVRDCSSFASASRKLLQVRMFYEWYEENIFNAFCSGMDLGSYAYFQSILSKLTTPEGWGR